MIAQANDAPLFHAILRVQFLINKHNTKMGSFAAVTFCNEGINRDKAGATMT